MDAEEGQLVGEVLGDPVRVDGRVRGVRGEDAGFLKGAQDPEGLRWVVCLGVVVVVSGVAMCGGCCGTLCSRTMQMGYIVGGGEDGEGLGGLPTMLAT